VGLCAGLLQPIALDASKPRTRGTTCLRKSIYLDRICPRGNRNFHDQRGDLGLCENSAQNFLTEIRLDQVSSVLRHDSLKPEIARTSKQPPVHFAAVTASPNDCQQLLPETFKRPRGLPDKRAADIGLDDPFRPALIPVIEFTIFENVSNAASIALRSSSVAHRREPQCSRRFA